MRVYVAKLLSLTWPRRIRQLRAIRINWFAVTYYTSNFKFQLK
jgi:hypothetical protein